MLGVVTTGVVGEGVVGDVEFVLESDLLHDITNKIPKANITLFIF